MEFTLKNHKLLIEKKLSLGLAESMTGGSLCYSFVKWPNASTYLKGSIVSYSEEAKKKVLHISEENIKTFGIVSKEIALIMATESLKLFKSNLAIAVTGFAGPLGDVGKVAFAIVSDFKEPLEKLTFIKGDRETIIKEAIIEIHKSLYEFLSAD